MYKNLLFCFVFGLVSCSPRKIVDSSFDNTVKSSDSSAPFSSLTLQSFGQHRVTNDYEQDALGVIDTAMTKDGKFVTVGTVNTGDAENRLQLLVNRYENDGKPDLSFGFDPVTGPGGGSTRLDLIKPSVDDGKSSGVEWATSLSLGPGDEILITGMRKQIYNAPFEPTRIGDVQGFVIRLTKDGHQDTSFNGGKWVDITIDIATSTDATHILDSAVDNNGRIVIVGYSEKNRIIPGTFGLKTQRGFVARLNQDGSFDSSFDGDGVFTFDGGTTKAQFSALYVQEDQKIVVGGRDADHALIIRLNINGAFDPSFANSGISKFTNAAHICDIQPQGSNTIFVGTSRDQTPDKLMRLNAFGQIDNSFGDAFRRDGIAKFANGTAFYGKCAMLIDKKDNSIYVATNHTEPRITKFSSDGSLDRDFPGYSCSTDPELDRCGHFIQPWPAVGVPGYPYPAIPRGIFINKDGHFVVIGRILIEFSDLFLKTIYGYVKISEAKPPLTGRF